MGASIEQVDVNVGLWPQRTIPIYKAASPIQYLFYGFFVLSISCAAISKVNNPPNGTSFKPA